MKTAIIGTGFIAEYHKTALQEAGCSLDLVISRNEKKAAAFAAGTSAAIRRSLSEEALSLVDAVIICTPPAEHPEALELCLRAGKHVFCEKPLCLDPDTALRLAELAEQAGVVTAVDFNNRFWPSLSRMKELSGETERFSAVYLQQYHLLPAPYSWRYTDPLRATSEIGSHMLDLMGWLTGKTVSEVRARFVNAHPVRYLREDGLMYAEGEGKRIEVKNEDEAVIDLRFNQGGEAHIELSEISEGHVNDIRLQLETDRGSLVWDNSRPHELLRNGETLEDGDDGDFNRTYRDALTAFLHSCETGERDGRLCSFREAAENVRLCMAIYDSAHRE